MEGKGEKKREEEDPSNVHYPPLIRMIGEALRRGTKEGDPIARRRKLVLIQVCLGGRFNGKSLVCGTSHRSKRDPEPSMRWGEGEEERLDSYRDCEDFC